MLKFYKNVQFWHSCKVVSANSPSRSQSSRRSLDTINSIYVFRVHKQYFMKSSQIAQVSFFVTSGQTGQHGHGQIYSYGCVVLVTHFTDRGNILCSLMKCYVSLLKYFILYIFFPKMLRICFQVEKMFGLQVDKMCLQLSRTTVS